MVNVEKIIGDVSVKTVLAYLNEDIKKAKEFLSLHELEGDSISMKIDKTVIDLLEYAKKAVVEEAKRRGLL
mgnify:CR=1 FL=1